METKYGGYMGKVMKIDLTTQQVSEYPWTDQDKELYLGGKIMAAKILYDNIKEKIDPYSAENMLVITTGPLTGTGAPSSGRFNISSLSPLTGFIGSSNSGGNFGIMLKKAGYDGLIITGKADKPTWINIENETITFNSAENLWGKTTSETQEALGGKTGKLVIGPAGENLVRYAAIVSEERVSGRTGVGAVMGSKNLKAIVVNGKSTVPVKNVEKKKAVYRKWVKQLMDHPITGKQLPKLGTAGLLSSMNANKILATRNFKYGEFKDFDKISGETLAEKHLIKNRGCVTCPIQCGRVVEVDGKQVKGPELETLGLLGASIENGDLELIFKINYLIDELGMDTISTGGTIAFAMELNENGLWDNDLKFGEMDTILKTIEDIGYRRGIGDLLAEGSKRLSDKFGGTDYAMHSKGLELSAYEPRRAVGQGLGYAVSNRGGCHINAGYMVLLEGLGLSMDPYTTKSKASLTIMFQNLMETVSAGGTCVFTMYAVIPGYLIENPNSKMTRFVNKIMPHVGAGVDLVNDAPEKALPIDLSLIPHIKALTTVTGMKMTLGKYKEIGERGYTLERLFNIRMGLTKEDDKLPKRLTKELQDPNDPRTKVPLEELKDKYYKLRGWDAEGVPKEKRLKKLKLTLGD